jgi:hypothetical protein
LLQLSKLGDVLFEAPAQARFLQVEILQGLFVLDEVLDSAGSRSSFFGIGGGPGEQSGFESEAAIQTPAGFGKRLNEFALAQSLGLVFVKVTLDVLCESGGIVRRQQNGATC